MLSPAQRQILTDQRTVVRRTMAQGRRWLLRSVLMLVVAAVAGYRGGQMNVVIAIAMVVLAALCFSLGRSLRKSAGESLKKIELMEKT